MSQFDPFAVQELPLHPHRDERKAEDILVELPILFVIVGRVGVMVKALRQTAQSVRRIRRGACPSAPLPSRSSGTAPSGSIAEFKCRLDSEVRTARMSTPIPH